MKSFNDPSFTDGGILVGIAGVITAAAAWLKAKGRKDNDTKTLEMEVRIGDEALELINVQQNMLEFRQNQINLLQKSLDDRGEILSALKTKIAVLELKIEACEEDRNDLRNLIFKLESRLEELESKQKP